MIAALAASAWCLSASTVRVVVVAVSDNLETVVTDNFIVDLMGHPLLTIGTVLALKKSCYLHDIYWLAFIEFEASDLCKNRAQTMLIS